MKKITRKVVFEGELTQIGGHWAVVGLAKVAATNGCVNFDRSDYPANDIEAELVNFQARLVRITIEEI